MATRNAYTVDGCPFMIDNVKGTNVIVDIATNEVIAEQGKDFNSLSSLQKWCDKLNVAWSDGYKRCQSLNRKK